MNDLSQARKLIKDCKDTQNPYLDLGNCGITDLNELPELFECEHIETLVLSDEERIYDGRYQRNKSSNDGEYNKISSVPKKISNFKKLIKLIINGNLLDPPKLSDISFLSNLTRLQYLNLGHNEISDISFLSNLTRLQNLNLDSNKISDISFLSNLTKLQDLNLSFNQISDISFLSNLTGLQSLNLGHTEISDFSFLSNLTRLQNLNLDSNKISDISFLSNLTRLQNLNLDSNKISDISFLSNLTKLQDLSLNDNEISDISFLSNLTKLQNLNLSCNHIPDISFLSNLTGLQNLNLDINEISDISILSNLTGLQNLNLDNNQISDTSFLSNLTKLQDLSLNNIRISDTSFLSNLTKLQDLSLDYTEISDISILSNLTRLQYLILSHNKISDISSLSNHTGLQNLNLSGNNISDISSLSNLTRLQNLNLSGNNISDISSLSNITGLQNLDLVGNNISDISSLSNITGLQNLELHHNQIKKIPKSIFQLNMKVEMGNFSFSGGLCLYNNPIESPPLEILNQGMQSILDWFDAEKRKLNQIKIIFIGEPKAGKTSLLKRLKYNNFNEKEVQTDGVNIEDIAFGECDTFKEQTALHNITGHFWDFGGQEIMNSTHQFFLTKRSIYVLVLDARIDKNNTTQIRDWVKRIRATGGGSPIIVVANQIDVNSSFGFVNERKLQEEFPQIKCFIKISCKADMNIDLLKEKLAELIPTAELFQTEIDERWITIKNRLQEETKQQYYLSEHQFIEICNEAKLSEEHGRQNVIKFLHDLGLILHFDDLNLSEYYVLDPYWITYGAYQILTSKYTGDEKGIVSMDKLEFIINEEEDKKESYQPANYRKINYSTNERRFLIDILQQFKLCFCIPDGSQFIIPDILDTTEPNSTDRIMSSDENVQFVYEYDYLPNSVMPNIMVKTHNIIRDMWRTGCILNKDGCEALITTYLNRISIVVTGEYKKKREFMAIIRYIIDSINQKLSSQITRLIPLPGIKDGFAEYERLITREKNGKTEYKHDEDKPTEKSFIISELLDGIPSEGEVVSNRKQLEKIITELAEIKADTEVIKTKLDSHLEYLLSLTNNLLTKDDIQEAIKEINTQQTTEIISEIATFFELFEKVMNDKLDATSKDIYAELKQTEDVQAKLSLSIPFINMLGINFDVEFDVKNWAKRMYEKHNLMIFKLMGAL